MSGVVPVLSEVDSTMNKHWFTINFNRNSEIDIGQASEKPEEMRENIKTEIGKEYLMGHQKKSIRSLDDLYSYISKKANKPEYMETLTETLTFLKIHSLSFEDRFQLLRQISLWSLRHRDEEIVLDPLSQSKILISARPVETQEEPDVRSLANLYCCILTNANKPKYVDTLTEEDLDCDDPYIALDLMRQMVKGKTNLKEVLQHPFYWSCFQKVLFLCRVVDYIHAERREIRISRKIQLDNYEKEKRIIPSSGWIAELSLTKIEIKRLQKMQKDAREQDEIIPRKKLICDIAAKSAKDEMSVYELLRFFRNRYVHAQEDTDDIRACFGNSPTGYWKFFSSRFPELFMLVYTRMKDAVLTENYMEEFAVNM